MVTPPKIQRDGADGYGFTPCATWNPRAKPDSSFATTPDRLLAT